MATGSSIRFGGITNIGGGGGLSASEVDQRIKPYARASAAGTLITGADIQNRSLVTFDFGTDIVNDRVLAPASVNDGHIIKSRDYPS